MLDLVFLFFNGTGVIPVYHPRGMCLSALNEIGVLQEGSVVLSVVTALWDNGLYGPLIGCRTTLDLGRDAGVEVMTLVGDASGVCLSPWLPGLSSCVCIVLITGLRVWYVSVHLR